MVLRQRVWIDNGVQGVLTGRIILYWSLGVVYLGLGSLCYQYNQHTDWTITKHAQEWFGQVWPWLPSLVLFLPLVLYDLARLSNLFAGPVYRLRKHLDELLQNPNCAPLTFRDDDYWQELVEPINQLQNQLLAASVLQGIKNSTTNSDSVSNTSKTEKPVFSEYVPNIGSAADATETLV